MTHQHPTAAPGRKLPGHSLRNNDLLQAALATTDRPVIRPGIDRPLYLFDLPKRLWQCLDALRFHGIGCVVPVLVCCNSTIEKSPRLEITIRYFRALDGIADAECVSTRCDAGGRYQCFELAAGDAVIKWSRPVEGA